MIVDSSKANGIFSFDSVYHPFADFEPNKHIVGAGGTEIFQLRGIKAGRGVFRMAYARSWEYDGNWEAYTGRKFTYSVGFSPI